MSAAAGRRFDVRRDGAWVAALAAGLAGYWFLRVLPQAVPRPGLVGDDLLFQFFPDHVYLAERLRAGELPQWNPHQGQPFLATLLPGTFHPARLLLLVLDVPAAMHASTVLHLILGAIATWALCRALGTARIAAALGAATFTGVHALPNVYTPAFLEGGAWLPVAGLALVHLAATARWRWAVALGTSLGLVVLAGCYQHAVYAAYGVAILGLALACDPARRGRLLERGTLAKLAAAAVLAVATAAPQALPTLAWSAETVRSGARLTDVQIDPFPFPWRTFRNLFVPPSEYAPIYVSVPVAVLALAGAVTGRRFGAVIGVAAVASALMVIGRGTPAFALFHLLPGFASFRGPERVTFLLAFFVAIVAALATSRLASVRRGVLLAGAVLGIVAWMLFAPPRAPVAFPWTVSRDVLDGPAALMRPLVERTAGGRALLPGGATADALGVKQATVHRILGVQDYNPLSSRRLARWTYAVVGAPPPAPDSADFFLGWIPLNRRIAHPALLDAMGVRTLLVRSFVPPWPALGALASDGRWTVYENAAALPRAYVVARARRVDPDAAIATMLAPGFDVRREACLAGAGEVPPELLGGALVEARPATLVVDHPEHVAVAVDAERPGVLVLTDPFAPGWTATLDGAPASVWEANGLSRGVVVPGGRSRIDFRYRAPGLGAGAATAAVVWGAALALALFGRSPR